MHIGIDLAWGPNGRTGLAEVDAAGRLLDSASVRTDDEIAAWLEGRAPVVVGIDAPLVVRNPTGQREAERLIAQAYRRFDAGAHPSNRGRPWMDPPRGMLLALARGWSTDPGHVPSAAAPVALEVYPHPGMVGLFGLGRIVPYKKGSFDARRRGFAQLVALLEGIDVLRLPDSGAWASIRARFEAARRPVDLDRLEDEIDAVFCAHLAWRWAQRDGSLVVYGDHRHGYVVAPPPPSHPPTPRTALPAPPTSRGGSADPQILEDAPADPARYRRGGEDLRIREPGPAVGVGPHPEPWPEGQRYDPDLLRDGDARNVVDRYRYWTMAAIVADLDRRRHPFAVAIENWQHDLNIGSIVRTANAFLADSVHIVGRRRWNRRGAMVTDRYQHVEHHDDVAGLLAWARETGRSVIAVDNVTRSVPVETFAMPERCLLLFGQEGPGLTAEALAAADAVLEIPQYGSTRSINASAAAAIVMHEWIRRWAAPPPPSGAEVFTD